MRARIAMAIFLAGLFSLGQPAILRSAQQKKDYLSDLEADKIRDAETPSERIKLFVSFAADRLKKFQYELGRTAPERNRPEMLNGLLNAYTGCIDDAADLVDNEVTKQTDIRQALKEFQTKGKEFLATLDKLSKEGSELDTYKENLQDAIEGTRDALKSVDDAGKKLAPPPSPRRKP
jgi:chromosome segregation ATPase